jgi:hypothetical protein
MLSHLKASMVYYQIYFFQSNTSAYHCVINQTAWNSQTLGQFLSHNITELLTPTEILEPEFSWIVSEFETWDWNSEISFPVAPEVDIDVSKYERINQYEKIFTKASDVEEPDKIGHSHT